MNWLAHQAPPSMEFSRQQYWSVLPFPSPGHLPNPGFKPESPALQADASPSEPSGKPKPMSTEPVMPSKHLILCCPLLLLPSTLPSIRVFSNESALHIRWPVDLIKSNQNPKSSGEQGLEAATETDFFFGHAKHSFWQVQIKEYNWG